MGVSVYCPLSVLCVVLFVSVLYQIAVLAKKTNFVSDLSNLGTLTPLKLQLFVKTCHIIEYIIETGCFISATSTYLPIVCDARRT